MKVACQLSGSLLHELEDNRFDMVFRVIFERADSIHEVSTHEALQHLFIKSRGII